jgi:hypothetical protein
MIACLFDIGHIIAQICLIMCPVPHPLLPLIPGLDKFLSYVQCFDIVPQSSFPSVSSLKQLQPDPVSGMYLLKQSMHSDGSRLRDIVPLSQCRVPIEITTRCYKKADPCLATDNSLEISLEFWLNKYFHKESYWGFHLTWHKKL